MSLDQYKESCAYIRKEFNLTDIASMYDMVIKITDAYKDYKDIEEIEKLKKEEEEVVSTATKTVEPSKKGKKRGRPRKQK
jgi:hypothetical protein